MTYGNKIAAVLLLIAPFGMSLVSASPVNAQSSYFDPKPPKTESEKAVYQVYRQSLEADRLFGNGKYAEAAALYQTNMAALKQAFRRDPAGEGYLIPVAKPDLAAARKYLEKPSDYIRNNGVSALAYSGLMELMLKHALQITGGKGPEGVFVGTDEDIIQRAYRDVTELNLPVPDDQWSRVVARLEMDAAKIEGVIKRHPDYQTELIDHSTWPDVTGAKAAAEAKQKLAQARPELEKASAKLQTMLPELVQHDLDMTLEDIDKMIAQTRSGEFIPAREADQMIGNRAQYLKALSNRLQMSMKGTDRSLPPNVLDQVVAKINELQAAIDAQAPHNSFPATQGHDATLEAGVRSQLARNMPQAKILRTAMTDAAWEVFKNNIGIPTHRSKAGLVLYKLPGEKWARLYRVVFIEQYAGGGTYAKADGGSQYSSVRWQKVEGSAGGR